MLHGGSHKNNRNNIRLIVVFLLSSKFIEKVGDTVYTVSFVVCVCVADSESELIHSSKKFVTSGYYLVFTLKGKLLKFLHTNFSQL